MAACSATGNGTTPRRELAEEATPPSNVQSSAQEISVRNKVGPVMEDNAVPSTSDEIINEIVVTPKISTERKRTRKCAKATLLTSTPSKNVLKKRERSKTGNEKKKKSRPSTSRDTNGDCTNGDRRAPTHVTNGTAFSGQSLVNGTSTISPVPSTGNMTPVSDTGTTCPVPNGTEHTEAELQQCQQQEQQLKLQPDQQHEQQHNQQHQQQELPEDQQHEQEQDQQHEQEQDPQHEQEQDQQQDQQHKQEQDQHKDQQEDQQDSRSWDEYCMTLAFLCAQRSKDPVTQVGACIADEQRTVLSTGYNGMPRGCPDHSMPWGKARHALTPLDAKRWFATLRRV